VCLSYQKSWARPGTTGSLFKFLMKICPAQPDKCQIVKIKKFCDVAVGQSKNLEEFFKKIYLNFRLTVRIICDISKASFEYLQKNLKEYVDFF